MPRVDVVVESKVPASARARQLEGMFDVPRAEYSRVEWHGDVDLDTAPGTIGLIVGPSGSGKTTIARALFGDAVDYRPAWGGDAVVDDFAASCAMRDIAAVCQAVGFNTIPAWLRPHRVLSTGEQFRVDLARRLLEQPDPIVVDEFTSTVDRQVAQIGAHAVQKYARRNARAFVAVTCHYDVIDWLAPDWVFEPATMTVSRRLLRRGPDGVGAARPPLDIAIDRVPHCAWRLFAPFHYLTNELHRAARCFCLFVGERPAAFGATLHRQHPKAEAITGLSRIVTLPDWQGLGLAFVLSDTLGAAYRAIGRRFHTYPAHPALIRGYDKSPRYTLVRKPGQFIPWGRDSVMRRQGARSPGDSHGKWATTSRPCATFSYIGDALPAPDARRLLGVA